MNDPKMYREMSEPFASIDECNAALKAFFEELYELRKKHGIRDLYYITAGSYLGPDGKDECQFITPSMCGNPLMAENMAAYAFGYEQAERQRETDRLLNVARERGKRRQ
jgi:hypothetical protein